MSTRSITDIFNDMVTALLINHNIDDGGITEITVSPYVFGLLENQFHDKERVFTPRYDGITHPPTRCTLATQLGILTIKKDLTTIIAEKKRRIETLQQEIKDLENE